LTVDGFDIRRESLQLVGAALDSYFRLPQLDVRQRRGNGTAP
jgi:hypothetical protein